MKKVGLIVLIFLSTFVAVGFSLPKFVHVERSISIQRPASMVFALLNGYEHNQAWSPWAERDPNAEFVVSGPESGVGARLSWIGDPQLVGSGWQEIVASKPFEQIDIKLDYDAQGVADVKFILVPQGGGTQVTWSFDSDLTEDQDFLSAFLARYFGLLFDRWVGRDYEQGLLKLKQYAESLPVADHSQVEISRVDVVAQDILYVTLSSSRDPQDIAMVMAAAYTEISRLMNETGVNMVGQPMAITRTWEGGTYQFDAAIPVDRVPMQLSGNVMSGQSPSGPAVRALHHGTYEQMMPTYEKLVAYMSAHGLSQGKISWEHYVTDPGNTAIEDLITHVYIMLDSPQIAE